MYSSVFRATHTNLVIQYLLNRVPGQIRLWYYSLHFLRSSSQYTIDFNFGIWTPSFTYFQSIEVHNTDGKMTQQVKVLSANLNLMPTVQTIEGKNRTQPY